MNQKIRDLTSQYLNELEWDMNISEEQKQQIAKINATTEWIIFNAGSLNTTRIEASSYDNMLKVDSEGYLWESRIGQGIIRTNEKLDNYIRMWRDRLGLVGNYKLGVIKGDGRGRNVRFREGEFEEELDAYGNFVARLQYVFGFLRNENGDVGEQLQQIRETSWERDRKASPENYLITSPNLKRILHEVVKNYYTYYQIDPDRLDEVFGDDERRKQETKEAMKRADVAEFEEPNRFNFVGGERVLETWGHLETQPAFPERWRGEVDNNYWGAINKKNPIRNDYNLFEPQFASTRKFWKKSRQLEDLLNDAEIKNSKEIDPSTSASSTTEDLTFTISEVMGGGKGEPHFLTLDHGGITVQGTQIYSIFIDSNDHLLKAGNEITIKGVELGSGRAEIDKLANDINIKNCFRTIEKVGTGGSGGGGSGPNQEISTAIQEIEAALVKYNFPLSGQGVWNDTNWKTSIHQASDSTWFLNRIYRQAAIDKVKKAIVDRGLSFDILSIPGGDLVQYFEQFSGENDIQAEIDRIVDMLDSKFPDHSAEIDTAIAEIRAKLKASGINQEQEFQILGSSWENNYRTSFSHETIKKIKDYQQGLLNLIDKHLAKNSLHGQKIIAEIKKILAENGLSESILGNDWQTVLVSQNQTEQEATKSRFLKIIEAAINNSDNLSDSQKKQANRKLMADAVASAKDLLQTKLRDSHPKLVVSETEISVGLAPQKTIEEKLNACVSLDELNSSKSKISVAIEQQRKNKLIALQEEAIQRIKTELKTDPVELGLNKDFEELFRGMVDPEQIEAKQNEILQSFSEQRAAKGYHNKGPNQTSPELSKWPKVLGIAALIVIPLAIISLLVFRFQKLRSKPKIKV